MEATYLELTVRLSFALVLGGAIGIEREYRAKEAGFRTHFLVALGSALFCIVSQFGFGIDLKDSSRVAAQVVSGIGFLGAGTILGVPVFGASYQPMLMMVLPPGAFILIGYLVAATKTWNKRRERAREKAARIAAAKGAER